MCWLGEGLSVVGAVGEALCLVFASRGVHRHDGALAEASGALVVYNGAAAEDGAPRICLDGVALEGPVHEVGRGGVAPCHVLPLRTVGVVLEVEVPDAVFIEHAVGVVHPSPGRGVVVDGTVLLAVCGVEGVRQLHVFPAGEA